MKKTESLCSLARPLLAALLSDAFWTSLFFTLWLAFFGFLIGVFVWVAVTA